ncbi:hypothetical protein LR004_00625 [Candidatus Gracilibacteria bacterium]|nr:hypothetical protein [Candidatus Gracilibacteria bacterium]
MTGEEGYFEVVRKAAVECEDSELIDAIGRIQQNKEVQEERREWIKRILETS